MARRNRSRPLFPSIRLVCAALAASAVVCAAGCTEREPPAVADAPPRPESDFASTQDLLQAVERGTFAERAGLTESLAAARAPDPIEIAFVSGTRVPESQAERLERVLRELEAAPDLELDLVGCSDPSGSKAINRRISQRRAESVADALEQRGVDPQRISRVEGLGESCDEQRRMVRVRFVPHGIEPRLEAL